jgi:hypothetical protein
MMICNRHSGKICRAVILLLIFVLMIGCGGIQPYEPRNHREEGPEKGLFTGSEGEWVIYRKAAEQAPESDDQKSTPEADDKQSKEDGHSPSAE